MENKEELLLSMIYRHIPSHVLVEYGLPQYPVKQNKKPVLTTEDGVDKYSGDNWYYINNHGDVKQTNGHGSTNGFITKRFHDKELALKESVRLHETKRFSLSDLNEIIKGELKTTEIREILRKQVYNK
jgi:hypothetical protein